MFVSYSEQKFRFVSSHLKKVVLWLAEPLVQNTEPVLFVVPYSEQSLQSCTSLAFLRI